MVKCVSIERVYEIFYGFLKTTFDRRRLTAKERKSSKLIS